jgi:lysophospholipase L1-like esterase
MPVCLTPPEFRRRAPSLAVAWLLAALLAGCGGGGSAAPATAPAAVAPSVQPGAWVVLGSSTAAGSGASNPASAWTAGLAANHAAHGVTLANLAVGGSTTYEALPTGTAPVAGRPAVDGAHNTTAALALGPKLVLISFPTNDTALGYSVDETVTNLLAMRSALQAGGAAVVLLSTQPRDLSDVLLARLPQIDQRLSDAAGACFVPVRAALAGSDGRLAPAYDSGDGVHPNDAGHALILQRVEDRLAAGDCVQAPR